MSGPIVIAMASVAVLSDHLISGKTRQTSIVPWTWDQCTQTTFTRREDDDPSEWEKPVSPPAVLLPAGQLLSVNSSTLSFFWKNKLSLLLSAAAIQYYGMSCSPLKEDFQEKKKQAAVYADISLN